MPDISNTDIKYLPGVGPKKAEILNKELEIFTLDDLLHYYPYKYIDKSRIFYVHEIDGNMPYIQLKGRITAFETFGEGRHKRLVGHFTDGTGFVDLVWFQGQKFVTDKYRTNSPYIVFGKPTVFGSKFNIAHPDIDPYIEEKTEIGGLFGYYNTTEKMKKHFLNSKAIQKIISSALSSAIENLPETLPPYILQEAKLMSIKEAMWNVHIPSNPQILRDAQYRLKFEELFYIQLNILRYTSARKAKLKGFVYSQVGENFNSFYEKNLPFPLTGAQKRIIREIRQDMATGSR